jgi:hypothetical protein
MPVLRQAAALRVDVRALSGASSSGRVHVKGLDNVHRRGRVAGPGFPPLTHGARQRSEPIIGCLSALVVDAMSGMITQVRPPRRDEMSAYGRAVPPDDSGKPQPSRRTGDATA